MGIHIVKGWHSCMFDKSLFHQGLHACYHYSSLGRSDREKYNGD